jgi:nucleoside phosphorylase
MSTLTPPRQSYAVGIICALDVEKAAVEAMLTEEHGRVEKAAGDDNAYTFGKIGAHNVVVACLPAGVMGKVSATAVAKDMMRSFPIKVGLMVGICGGVWSERADVRLGDVVVSQPEGMHGGVVQWDYGKMERDGVFKRTGTLNKPPRPLLNAVQSLKSRHRRKGNELHQSLEKMLSSNPYMVDEYGYPGLEHDDLFEASYGHPHGDTCVGCDRSRLCNREPRKDERPLIHYGNIASGDQVVKDAPTRDRIAREEGILCFEMEAAGLMDTFPCMVIRGVCDYADSHKNKRWQSYAAATAACYAKELLGELDAVGVEQLGPASE